MGKSREIDFSKRRLEYFDKWREAYCKKHDIEKLTLKMIADKIHMEESTLSRKIRDEYEFTEKEVLALSNLFGISCDEFITGTKCENINVGKIYGLKQKALLQLENMNKTEPNLVAMLDIVLENKYLADTLLRSFIIYVETPMFKLSTIMPTNAIEEIALTSTTGREFITSLLISNYRLLLEALKHEWEKRVFTHPVLNLKKIDADKMKKKKSLSKEDIRRLRTKFLTSRIRKKPLQEYWKTVDDLAKYKEFQLFMEKGLMNKETNEDY